MATRRDPFRDPAQTAGYVEKLGTITARTFAAVVDQPQVTYLHQLVLLGVAHHADLMRVAGRTEPAYATDVSELTGVTAGRAKNVLGELKRWGLLSGSAQAGFTPAGPLLGE